MAHLLTPPAPTTAPTPLSAITRKSSLNYWKNNGTRVSCFGRQYQNQTASSISGHDHQLHPSSIDHSLHRRSLMGLSGALALGLSLSDDKERASAAARRPPPPPPQEKRDPNLSGVQAKVLASKKRKEAMKEEVARLRERGKAINNAAPPPPPPPPQPEQPEQPEPAPASE